MWRNKCETFVTEQFGLAEFVENERHNLDVWDDLDGCRGKQQMEESQKESLVCKTGGIQRSLTT